MEVDAVVPGRGTGIGTSGFDATGDVDKCAAVGCDDVVAAAADGETRLGDCATPGDDDDDDDDVATGTSVDALSCADRLRRGDTAPAAPDAADVEGSGESGLDIIGDFAPAIAAVDVVVDVVVANCDGLFAVLGDIVVVVVFDGDEVFG